MGQTALDIPQWHSCSKDKDDSLWSMASMVNYWIWGCRIFAWGYLVKETNPRRNMCLRMGLPNRGCPHFFSCCLIVNIRI